MEASVSVSSLAQDRTGPLLGDNGEALKTIDGDIGHGSGRTVPDLSKRVASLWD